MHPDADLSVLGAARPVDEFLDLLEMSDVTLVLSDWGGAQRPVAWGRMTERPVPPEIMDARFRPVPGSAGVRRDLRAYVLSTPPKAELLARSEALRTFDRPTLATLAARAAEDRPAVPPPADHPLRLRPIN